MSLEEAMEWLEGKRSMANTLSSDDYEAWHVRVAQSDAAMTQRAYYTWRYHRDMEVWNDISR